MSLFLIAEIGINHNGNMTIAKQLIDYAADAGFNAVKFQKRNPDICVPEKQKKLIRNTPWGEMSYLEYKKRIEFGKSQYDEISRYCKEKRIEWFASPWDVDSYDFLKQYNLNFYKVASAMLTNLSLMHSIAGCGVKTFISTGMSTMEEISRVVDIFREHHCAFELMHCNSAYPMPEEEANLLCIPMLKDKFKCHVGYSGHESSLLKVCSAAVALGATSIERHITLDKTMYGTDQSASIEVKDLQQFVSTMRNVESILGNGIKTVTNSEIPIREKLRPILEHEKLELM